MVRAFIRGRLAIIAVTAMLAAAIVPAAAAPLVAPSVLGGQVLYAERCASCHAAPAQLQGGPSFEQPAVVIGVRGEPPKLSASQIVLIANYLRTREPNASAPVRRVRSAALSDLSGASASGDCAACHAAAVQSAWRPTRSTAM